MLLGLVIVPVSCEKAMEGELYRVYDEIMMDQIMEEIQLTEFLSLAEKGEMRGVLHAVGANTLFVPSNEAVEAYLREIGKTSVNDLTKEEAEAIVTYHLIRDTLPTADFVDGRLPSPNFQRKYLTTKTEAAGIRINRQALITTKDLRGGNGYLHIIDKVLSPPVESVADRIMNLPDSEYSFLKTLFTMSGLRDSLSIEKTDYWYTFFIQDNQSFEDAGILTVEDLLVQLRANTPAIEDDTQLIANYIAYHCTNSLNYVTDLLSLSSLQTLVPKQVIMFKRNLDVVLLNEVTQGQETEPGIPVDRASDYTDWSCSNGVIHKIDGNIQIINRTAYRVYWDICEQPEIMALKTFRKAGAKVSFAAGELSGITWGGKTDESVWYNCGGYSNVFDDKFQYVYGDYLRFRLSTTTMQWIEFKTPVLVEGKYKVWLCWRREHDVVVKTTFKQEGYDDQPLPFNVNLAEYMLNPEAEGSSHEQIEIEGWKQYNAKKFNSVVNAHLLGIISVETTGQHVLRFDVVSSAHSYEGSWDLIEFIPIDEDQLWPRVDIKGNWFYSDKPACEAWPPDCAPVTETE
jgi:uncharacterized surface protein with fasciclin (FAS1) repeats